MDAQGVQKRRLRKEPEFSTGLCCQMALTGPGEGGERGPFGGRKQYEQSHCRTMMGEEGQTGSRRGGQE